MVDMIRCDEGEAGYINKDIFGTSSSSVLVETEKEALFMLAFKKMA
jgi:hypothetical protein